MILRTGRDWWPGPGLCYESRLDQAGAQRGDLAHRVRPSSLHLRELFQKKSGWELGTSKYKHNSFQTIHQQLCIEHLQSVTFQLSANRNECCYIQIIAFILDKGCFELIIEYVKNRFQKRINYIHTNWQQQLDLNDNRYPTRRTPRNMHNPGTRSIRSSRYHNVCLSVRHKFVKSSQSSSFWLRSQLALRTLTALTELFPRQIFSL